MASSAKDVIVLQLSDGCALPDPRPLELVRLLPSPHFSRRVSGGAGSGRLIAAEAAMEVGRAGFYRGRA